MEKDLNRSQIAALESYPEETRFIRDYNQLAKRQIYQQGYEQAGKDIISHIREQIERWMPQDNGEEHIKGERIAFNSVLHLLKEMEEE